jgi:hypothetical protein
MNVEQARRVERVARIAAISAAASAPLVAVPLAFAAVERAAMVLGVVVDMPAPLWRLAIGGLSALWAATWTARQVPGMVRARLRGHLTDGGGGR